MPPTAVGSVPHRQHAGSWKDDLAEQLGIGSQMTFTVRRAATLTMTWRQAGVHLAYTLYKDMELLPSACMSMYTNECSVSLSRLLTSQHWVPQVAAMDGSAFGRLGQDYASAMAACLLQLRGAAPTEAATATTSRRLVGRPLRCTEPQRCAALNWHSGSSWHGEPASSTPLKYDQCITTAST